MSVESTDPVWQALYALRAHGSTGEGLGDEREVRPEERPKSKGSLLRRPLSRDLRRLRSVPYWLNGAHAGTVSHLHAVAQLWINSMGSNRSRGGSGSRQASAAPATSTSVLNSITPNRAGRNQLAVDSSPMLTLQWVANYFSVEERTIYRWIEQGIIRGRKIGGRLRFHLAEIERIAFASDAESNVFDGLDAHIEAMTKSAQVTP